MGPIETYVLEDLEAWLKSPIRQMNCMENRLSSSEKKIIGFEDQKNNYNDLSLQISSMRSETNTTKSKISQLEQENAELSEAFSTNKKILTLLGLLVITVVMVILLSKVIKITL
jgi:hypothetical protein